jgi:hypothetical protein
MATASGIKMDLEILRHRRLEYIQQQTEEALAHGSENTDKAMRIIMNCLDSDARSTNVRDICIGICQHQYPGIIVERILRITESMNLKAKIILKRNVWGLMLKKYNMNTVSENCDENICQCIHIINTWQECGNADPPKNAIIKKEE